MSSGVTVNPECLDAFQLLKLKKKSKYIIFTLNDQKTEVVVEKTSSEADYDKFLADLPENQCRWAVYDFEYQNEEGSKRNKIILFSWTPDTAKVKDKMVSASSQDAVRRSFVGIAMEIQGTEYSEVAHETVLDKAQRGR